MNTRRTFSQISIKVGDDQLDKAHRWAHIETEGNVSLMLRKLIDEAIAARDATEAVAASRRGGGR